jgi:predicted dehydrogenase
VVGAGSIGRRHLKNLRTLGVVHLAVCDLDTERLLVVQRDLGAKPFRVLSEGLEEFEPRVVIICTPPNLHVEQARQAIRAGAHVFVEKPLSHTIDGVATLLEEIQASQCVAQVGYNLRFHPALKQVKHLVEQKAIGRVLWARAEFGQYLPDWRPWQDYRQSYTASKELGGGILLDASHEVDYLMWFFGRPTEVICMADKVSNLEVNVEDSATMLLRFSNGTRADVHVDFIQRSYARSCKLVGEKGSIIWDFAKQQTRIYKTETKQWDLIEHRVDNNEMYLKEMDHFLTCVEEKRTPMVDVEQAAAVLDIILAAKEAAKEGKVRQIKW